MVQQLARQSVKINSGQSLSDAIAVHGQRITTIEMPAAWDAANLTFQGSMNNSSFFDIYQEDGTEVTITAAAGRRIHVDSGYLSEHAYIKVRSGTAGTPVNQTAERSIYLEIWA